MSDVITIARLEFTGVARLKWIRLLAAAFALLSLAAAYSAGAASELSGADGFARTTMTLIPVALILIPLAAVVLGVAGQSAESGSEPFLFAQPISRAAVLVGRWLGEWTALGSAIACGFGIGALVVASGAGIAGAGSFVLFTAAAIVLAGIFLSIGATIAAATEKRLAALGAATFVWFVFVLLYDAVALSVAGWVTGSIGGRILFVSVFGNPADLIRIAMLRLAGTAHVLGAAGDAWTRFLGGDAMAASIAAAALGAWVAGPLAIGVLVLRARDL
jgi:Cu-processing system permease protein